jgi:hypothetical protein
LSHQPVRFRFHFQATLETTTTTTTKPKTMSKRLFIADLLTGSFLANSRECVRIMGVILGWQQPADIHDNPRFPGFDPSSCGEMILLTLDDGTATATLWTPKYMIERLSAEPGQNMECIIRLRQKGTLKRWYTDTLIKMVDPAVEALRWMELSRPPSQDECRRQGFPRIKMNSNEVYRLICVHTDSDKAGLSAEDLALVMHTPLPKMKDYIVELQLNGMIYQNAEGNFVPL